LKFYSFDSTKNNFDLAEIIYFQRGCQKKRVAGVWESDWRQTCRDYYFEYSRDYLGRRCQRANLDEWSHFCSVNIVLKTLSDKYPSRLHSVLRSSYFKEPRKGGLGNFFDKLKTKVGKQLIQHRLAIISEKLFSLGMMLNCPMIQLEFYLKKLTFLIVNNFFIILWSLALIPHILF